MVEGVKMTGQVPSRIRDSINIHYMRKSCFYCESKIQAVLDLIQVIPDSIQIIIGQIKPKFDQVIYHLFQIKLDSIQVMSNF